MALSTSVTPPATITPDTITPVILDTVLGHLAPHFLASSNGDLPTARHAASHILAAYHAETEEELRLAAAIVGFGFQALQVLAESVPPDLSLSRKLRLRSTAVSLSREGHKASRKLDQLRLLRGVISPRTKPGADIQAVPAQRWSGQSIEPAPNLGVPAEVGAIAASVATAASKPVAQPHTVQASPISRQQRRAAERAAKKRNRHEAEQARRKAAVMARKTTPPMASADQPGAV